jgi:hypothetical protein
MTFRSASMRTAEEESARHPTGHDAMRSMRHSTIVVDAR